MTDSKVSLKRSGQPDLVFTGRRLLSLPCTRNDLQRFHEYELYRKPGGILVFWLAFKSKVAGESSILEVHEFPSHTDAVAYLQGYDPTKRYAGKDEACERQFKASSNMVMSYLKTTYAKERYED